MKNVFVSLLILFWVNFPLYSSSITLISADTLLFTHPTAEDVKAYCSFKNTSEQKISVKLKLKLLEITDGLEILYCWGPLCRPSPTLGQVDEPDESIPLQPGEISNPSDFYFTFNPYGQVGKARLEAIIYNVDNPFDSLRLEFTFTSSFPNNVSEHNNTLFRDNRFFILGDADYLINLLCSLDNYEIYNYKGMNISMVNKLETNTISTLPNGLYLILAQKEKALYKILYLHVK
ncbi:MAG: hypothetical protein N2517_05620 [Ignavibacteria bacterium]|nr:hypothetical protein [Ignavibacteria bacterium]